MYYIGIDLGTSAVKLLLVDEDGTIIYSKTKDYPIFFPQPGWSEQNPSDWWAACQTGIVELLADVKGSTDTGCKINVAGIGVAGQMHGLVILDENDEIIRPAILWNDGRADLETFLLNTLVGEKTLSSWTANIAFAGFTAPKLLWLKDNEPENFARIKKIMLPKDYINYKLTGVHACDFSDASGMLLLDVEHKCWSQEMLDYCEVDESQMPKLFESYDVIGTLLPETANKLGLSPETKVVAGAGDNAAAAVGTGTVSGCAFAAVTNGSTTCFADSDSVNHADGDPAASADGNAAASADGDPAASADGDPAASAGGDPFIRAAGDACNISLGTSGTIFISSDHFRVDPNNALHAFAHADGRYHLMGCMLSAASCNKWFCDDILQTKDYAAEQSRITDDMLGNNSVFFLPYLMGERSPINDTDARGMFIGLSMDTSRTDMLLAVLEGVAFAIRDSFRIATSLGIRINRSKICGGGAKSPLWRKIIANVLNIPLDIPQTEEGPGYGAAMLAMVGCGQYEDVGKCAAALVRTTETIFPDSEIASRYDLRYWRFRCLYPAVKELFQTLK